MRRNVLLVAVLLAASVSFAHSDEASLNQQYKNRILTLRHPFKASSQTYDASGNALKPGKEGPWTLYGRIQVVEIKLRPDNVEIRGRRTGLVNENGCLSDYGVGASPLHVPDPIGTAAIIHIQIAPGEAPESAMAKVFALTEQDLLGSVPDLWKSYVRSRLDPQSRNGQWEFTPGEGPDNRFTKPVQPTPGDGGGQSVAAGTPGVVAPKAKYTPEPDYGGEIGRALVRGSDKIAATIDVNGNLTSLAIVNPIGLGVDESAAAAMKRWKFEPGRLNGKPVPVNMTLEVQYKRDR